MMTQNYNVVVTRTFDAPLEKIWQAWSQSDYVKQWWGPTGFTCPLAEMDFREGGTALVCMRAPQEYGGGDMYNTWTYQNIVPMEKLEFVQHFTDKGGKKLEPSSLGLPPGIPESVRHVITFKELGNNKTELTVTEYGYVSEEVVAVSKQGMEQCLDKMAALFS
jgi:uncharacterized protein YndB with AHSA1/START domain